jgi:Putative MetA-pathway of phenol degradation
MARLRTYCGRQIPLVLFAVSTFQTGASAQGGPPMITDDPDTPRPGFWEINISALSDSTRNERHIETPRVDVNYGAGARTQLKFEVPWLYLRSRDDGNSAQGLGDATVGIKWRFLGEEGTRVAWSVYPQVEFNTAHSSVNRELVDAGPDYQLPTEITVEVARVEINGEVGCNFIVRGERHWIGGLSTEVHASPGLELLAELHAAGDSGTTIRTHRESWSAAKADASPRTSTSHFATSGSHSALSHWLALQKITRAHKSGRVAGERATWRPEKRLFGQIELIHEETEDEFKQSRPHRRAVLHIGKHSDARWRADHHRAEYGCFRSAPRYAQAVDRSRRVDA